MTIKRTSGEASVLNVVQLLADASKVLSVIKGRRGVKAMNELAYSTSHHNMTCLRGRTR